MKSSSNLYYNLNAQDFIDATINIDMSSIYMRFLEYLPPKGRILDIGCGSGRDLKFFREKGYDVIGIEPSIELYEFAKEYSGCEVKNIDIQSINPQDRFDGIWASASLLHLTRQEIRDTFFKISHAIKSDAIIYCSFKYGDFEGEREDGRYFTHLTEESFSNILDQVPFLAIREIWVDDDRRPDRKDQWLNALVTARKD